MWEAGGRDCAGAGAQGEGGHAPVRGVGVQGNAGAGALSEGEGWHTQNFTLCSYVDCKPTIDMPDCLFILYCFPQQDKGNTQPCWPSTPCSLAHH